MGLYQAGTIKYDHTSAEQQTSLGTPMHEDVSCSPVPQGMMPTSNQTLTKILERQILPLEGTVPRAEIMPAIGIFLHHWLYLFYNLP